MQEFYAYIPATARHKLEVILQQHPVEIKVVNTRKSKHGDFRKLPSGKVQITLNVQANPYRFLITLLHEIAHHLAFKWYGFRIAPHGKEWKLTFRELCIPFLEEAIFPQPLLTVFAQHLNRPKASSDTDVDLGMTLRQYDPPTNKLTVLELPQGALFQLDDGRTFVKGPQRRKRFTCRLKGTQKVYLFQPNAEVYFLE